MTVIDEVRIEAPAPVRLLASKILRGCNIHHASTVIRQEVHLGGLAGVHSGEAGPDFAKRFLDRFAKLRGLVPESAMSEGFLERLRSPRGAPFEEVLLEAILAVETAMAFAQRDFDTIGFAGIVPSAAPQRVLLVWESHSPKISRSAAEVGLAGCLELLPEDLRPDGENASLNFKAAFAALEARARRAERSTTTAVLALAAKRRGLPCEVLRGPHLRLGQGASQRKIYASVTERTSLAATQLARNKHRTNRRLAELCLPVTRQMMVATAEEAIAAAATLGYPVVVKPLKQKQAAGVSVGVANPDDIAAAFARARAQRTDHRVIVETFVPGHVHRLLVIGGRFIAALQTIPPTVTGNGEKTIAELVEELNTDPVRDGVHLYKVEVDDELARDLSISGYDLGHVLEKGRTVALRLAANVAIGGLHSDVTDSVHPDNREMVIRAAEGIGLDVAGIDFVTQDISRSYQDVGGSIIEVNARPGLCMHTCPWHGQSRRAGEAFLELSFPPGTTGRIPVAMIAGDRGAARTARDLDAILRASGKSVGLATRKTVFVNAKAVPIEKSQRRKAVPILLRDPRVEALVSTVSLRRTMKRGLGLETCDVAAVMTRAPHKSLDVLVRATRGALAVGADNEVALQALSGLDPKRLILVGSNPQDPVIARHVAAEGPVVLNVRERDQDWIVLYREGKVIVSMRVETHDGERISARRMQTRMFAVALAFGMGLSVADIEAAVRSAPSLLARKASPVVARVHREKSTEARKSGLPAMERSWVQRDTFARADEWGRNLEALGIPAFGMSLLTLAQDFAYGAAEEVKGDCILIRRDARTKILPLVSDWKEYDRILKREAAALPAAHLLGYVPRGRTVGSASDLEIVESHREFVYHRENLAAMAGSALSKHRRQVRLLLKAGAHVEPIGPANLDRVLACNDRWYAGKKERGRKTYYRGRTVWTFENLALLEELGVRHLAVILDGDVAGYGVGSHVGASWAVFTFRRGDREPRGVAPYLLAEMAKLYPGREWINDGPAVRKPGLAWFKEKFTSKASEKQMNLGWIKA